MSRAITALRYFYEEKPALHVAAAGSLLEIVLNRKKRKPDFPVGRVRSVFMYPFSFTEFLRGTGRGILCDFLEGFDFRIKPNDAHDELIEEYKNFLVVGGMPEAVAEYAETKSLLASRRIHRDILASLVDDFGKYSDAVPTEIIGKVFLFASRNVCSQTKASSAIPGVSAYYFDECVHLLQRAGLVYPVKASSCNTVPLGATEKETNKKLLLFDTGIYLTECGLDAGGLLAAELFDDLNKGDIVEMQTGLEMVKHGDPYSPGALHYWYRCGANAKVDYVLQKRGETIPVEVKASGKGRMQSMRAFLDAHESAPYGIRVSLEDFCEYGDIRVFPAYAVCRFVRGECS